MERQPSGVGPSPVQTGAVPDSTAVNHDEAGLASEYEEIGVNGISTSQAASNGVHNPAIGRPPPVYAIPHKPAASPSVASSAPSVSNASGGDAVVYSDTATTLVDNDLYGVQRPTVTSSNDADDVTDLTLIDNDLYERVGQGQGQSQGQSAQNAGDIDYECTLIENDLYHQSADVL